MAKALSIETLLKSGSAEWNKLRKAGKVAMDHTGATFAQLFSANADLSQLSLVGTEWEKCDLSKVNFRETDLSNAYFHGGRLQDCDFRGANLDGATFEKLKLLRCDFTGARGLDSLELEDVDMDRVAGLGEEEPPPPPPPAQGITAFTREMRTRGMDGPFSNGNEPPPFRPHDGPASLLFRGLKRISPPAWALDVPSLRPPIPTRLPPNALLEGLYREAVKEKLEARTPAPDAEAVRKAQKALRLGSKEAHIAAAYLREVNVPAEFRFSSARVLKDALRAELEIDDLTASIDPRITAALLALRLPNEAGESLAEARRRLSATQLFCALLEAGFTPENNWEEALESSEPALDLAQLATQGDRAQLTEAFRTFAALPEEARLRRLAYLGEAVNHLQELTRLPQDTEPSWLSGPESRECHEREMDFVQSLRDGDIPVKVAELASTELGIPSGQVPEDSAGDLFLHLRCAVCGKEKLLVQSAEA